MPKPYGQTCPVAQSLEFLGERWTLLVIRDLLAGPRRFRDLSHSMPGVAPAVLSHRLKVLETHGIVSRRLYSDHPPRAEYALTDRGRELRTVVRALGIWGSRHLDSTWTFVHDACGADVEIAYYCPACDDTVSADQVERRPAPARRHTRPARRSRTAKTPVTRRSAR